MPTRCEEPPPLGTLGDYTLRRQIGRGGMGVVYDAWQNSVERRVALKMLPAGVAVDNKAFVRFMREAKTAAQLNHPHVVHVYGLGIEEHTPYFAMEYVEGQTLAEILSDEFSSRTVGFQARHSGQEHEDGGLGSPPSDGPLLLRDPIALAAAFADVADGLQHAHSRGVIHRDIKPSNLILDPEADRGGRAKGRLRILDFGLARLEGQESLTFSGDIVGTPLYMSPEQARRRAIGGRSPHRRLLARRDDVRGDLRPAAVSR